MTADVARIDEKYLYSLTQLSAVFGIARETVSKRLQRASVTPADERRGHAVYHIASASRAIIEGDNPELGFDQVRDPDKLPPKDRLDWYKSQNEKLKYEKEEKLAIGTAEHEHVLSDVLKIQLRAMDTLEDMLEREGVGLAVLEKVARAVDKARHDLADKLEQYEYSRVDSE